MIRFPSECSGNARRRARRLACGAVLAALASTATFVNPTVASAAFDSKYYDFCIHNIGQGVAYCCAQAGGTVIGDQCLDPALIVTAPTITRQPIAPPIVIIPTAP